jgi:hypothetical protein
MRNTLLLLMLCVGPLCADDDSPVLAAPLSPPPGKALWKASLVSIAAAQAMDMQSSWGKRELNSTLSGAAGKFGMQGALIKLALQGSVMSLEYVVTRGRPTKRLYRALSAINFGAAATTAAVASHNYTVPRP